MAFQEKSAWVMMFVLLIAGLFYINSMLSIEANVPAEAGKVALVPIFGVYVAIVVITSIIGQIAIAIFSPNEASSDLDERDELISAKAGNLSGMALGAGIVGSLLSYLWFQNGIWLFHAAFLSLMASALVEYGLKVFYYRRGY
ncbi:MAG: hypothetical protein AAFW82_09065 [Pseudomonadota bacterium]